MSRNIVNCQFENQCNIMEVVAIVESAELDVMELVEEYAEPLSPCFLQI